MIKKYIFHTAIIFILFACADKKNEREATARLAEIEQLVSAEKYNAAMIALDSFHINFPQMIDLRHLALALEDTVSVRQSRRIIAFCDSASADCEQKLDSLRIFFRFEKDKKFQTVGNFIYKNQAQNADTGSSFWTCVDENSDFYIVKNFYGGLPNGAVYLTVCLGDIFASTDTIPENSQARHKFETLGNTVETLTLKNGEIDKFAAFINQFSDKNLTVRFGKSGKYQFSADEKRSISITYQFWKLQKEFEKLKLQKLKAIKKITALSL